MLYPCKYSSCGFSYKLVTAPSHRLLQWFPVPNRADKSKESRYPKGSQQAMVLGILTALAACPAIIGTTEAVRQGQKKDSKEKHRSVKSNVTVSCLGTSRRSREIDGGLVVLRNKKVRSLRNV